MAKRFTDTQKWKHDWFGQLTLSQKLLWFYICDECDATGVWPINLRLASFYLGQEVTEADLDALADDGKRLLRIDSDKLWLTGFISFQYRNLSPKNKAHLGIMRNIIASVGHLPLEGESLELIEKFRFILSQASSDPHVTASRPSKEGQQTLQEKEKEKEKVKEEEKIQGGVGGFVAPTPISPRTLPPSQFVHEAQPLDAAELDLCYQAWLETLAHYKATRAKVLPAEQLEIARAVQRQGNAKAVFYALQGARYEPKSDRFNPADYLKINRVLDSENFNRFMNLGIQAEHKKTGSA